VAGRNAELKADKVPEFSWINLIGTGVGETGQRRTGRIHCVVDRRCATRPSRLRNSTFAAAPLDLRGCAARDSNIARAFPVYNAMDKRGLISPPLP
jgi:hypothetical protein